jgi:transcriptional regulator with XRE-family HTH domain
MGMQALGNYLRELREAKDLTRKDAAALVSSFRTEGTMSYKTVERWEFGRHEPTLTILRAYVRALGGSVDRAVALLLSRPTNSPDDELTPEEIEFFTSLSPARRRALRAAMEADRNRD